MREILKRNISAEYHLCVEMDEGRASGKERHLGALITRPGGKLRLGEDDSRWKNNHDL